MEKYTYLALHLFTVLFPLLFSFDSRISYYKNWKYLFPAITLVAGLFIVWDTIFTKEGVWNFNENYVTGIYLNNLPLEEIMFFFTVPYSCVFIYESLKYYIRKNYFIKVSNMITAGLILYSLLMAIFNLQKLYTFYTFLFLALALTGTWLFSGRKFFDQFYIAYAVHLIPFAIVNGILTALPVVVYNNNENLGIRMGTIPLEDAFYSMLLLLLNIFLFEYFKRKFSSTPSESSKTDSYHHYAEIESER